MRWGMRLAAGGAVVVAAMAFAGCAASPMAAPTVTEMATDAAGGPGASGGAAPGPATPAATATPSAVVVAAGTEVGSAVFTARLRSEASGSFVVVATAEPGRFDLVPQGFAGPPDSELTLLPYVIDDAQTCADTGFRFSFGSLETLGTAPLPLPPHLTQGDPSVFASAVLTVYSDADREQNDCLATVVAAAPIQWSLTSGRPAN